jgi:1-phosphofructokinase
MIYTVTFNPSLDYIVRLDDLRLGEINRVNYEQVLPGGKGINVSIVLSNLGHKSTALGFVAGFTGREIVARMSAYGATCDFIQVKEGMSRINVKAKAKEETAINGLGPKITPQDIDALYAKLDALQAGDLLVIAGNVPSMLPSDIYERIMSRLDGRGIDIVVDAERDLLVNVLPYHPFLVKPNNHELGDIVGATITHRDEVEPYARMLQERGARNVLVSMGGEGAVLVPEKGDVIMSEAPKGTMINTVGAGDSMVAGFLTGWIESNGDYETAFKMGVCTGSASAFSDNLATRPEVEALLAKM